MTNLDSMVLPNAVNTKLMVKIQDHITVFQQLSAELQKSRMAKHSKLPVSPMILLAKKTKIAQPGILNLDSMVVPNALNWLSKVVNPVIHQMSVGQQLSAELQ